jgi:cellulose synthase/poly-beta-1,6-N-acetylglucosamine synthase-like glycosyltransferase
VPAHNEERVIGHLLDSLLAQSYERACFEVFVSCDACTDRTAEIAHEKGATVLTRRDRDTTGKTANLRSALREIPLERFDLVAVFDSDNVLDENFLAQMNDYIDAHPDAAAVQGYLDVKNPEDSWVTRVYAISFWYANRFWQLSRNNVGLSANLGGTGEVIRASILREVGWQLRSLTDDLELTCEMILRGYRVHYAYRAVTYDEKPHDLGTSQRQRTRWLLGHYSAFRRYGVPLLLAGVRRLDLTPIDLLLHLAIPGRAAMSYLTMLGAPFILSVRTVLRPDWVAADPAAWLWVCFGAAALVQTSLVLVLAPSLHAGRFTLSYLRDGVSYFIYGMRWLGTLVTLLFAPNRTAVWIRTEHSRPLSLRDVNQAKRQK